MGRNIKKYLIILAILFVIFLIITEKFSTLADSLGASDSMLGAKMRGTYICEYTTPQNPYKINDSIILHVKESWLEQKFYYTSNINTLKVDKTDGYNLIVLFEENLPSVDCWTIGINFKRNFRSYGKNGLITEFDSFPSSYEMWQVQSKDYLDSIRPKDVIGKFELTKKK